MSADGDDVVVFGLLEFLAEVTDGWDGFDWLTGECGVEEFVVGHEMVSVVQQR